MGLRIATTAAFSAGILGLSACGGGDSEAPKGEAAQSQTPTEAAEPDAAPETVAEPETEAAPETAAETAAEPAPEAEAANSPFADALLTEEEFPLEGFTRGEVVAETGGDGAAEDEAEGALDDLTGGQDLSAECEEALQFSDVGGGNVGDGSSVDFTGATSSAGLPTSVSVAVAPLGGESPLEALSKVSSECDSFTIEEEGQSMTMNFDSLDELEGTEISVESAGFEFGFIIGGESNDDVVVLAFAVGVDEADVAKVVETQLEKVDSAG